MVSASLLHPQVDVKYNEVQKEIHAGQYRPTPDDRVLHTIENISGVWPGPPPHGHLHVFVNVVQAQTLSTPVLGKRSRVADDPELTDLPWLEEVHSKIWNRKDLRPQLFRKVEVTQAHYAALQKRLKELHSDRDSPDYDGTKTDVLSVKLDFLRSLPPAEALSPRHDDYDSEASNEDDLETKSLFPSILSFFDLSTLELKENVPVRFPLPLLLRQEYEIISELIKKRPQSSAGSVIVSGQPGTGEFHVTLSH